MIQFERQVSKNMKIASENLRSNSNGDEMNGLMEEHDH